MQAAKSQWVDSPAASSLAKVGHLKRWVPLQACVERPPTPVVDTQVLTPQLLGGVLEAHDLGV